MRSKLLFAFLAVILLALISNLIFERRISSDFDEYVMGTREDQLYWVLASIEGSWNGDGWNPAYLMESVHWAMMLGYEAEVFDTDGATVVSSKEIRHHLSDSMLRRMDSMVHFDRPVGERQTYPLFVGGEEIGSLAVRPLSREGLATEIESVFKRRARIFLAMSFLIAGGSALFLAAVFSLFLTRPVMRLKNAAEAVASGDLGVRVRAGGSDEIGSLSESFNRMVEALERQENLRKHLTSNIAHELRTPLTVIKASLEALTDGVVTDTEGAVEGLRGEVERLIVLVEGIEDITKAEASFFSPPEKTRIGARYFLSGMVEGMRPLFIKKGLDIVLAEGPEFEIDADMEKLEIAVRNILSNALRHTGRGGVTVAVDMKGKEFVISVADTGAGIPEKDLQNIFKRFYKGEGSEGIGLGLAIAKELVEIMGGRIEARSREGEGATFSIVLPA